MKGAVIFTGNFFRGPAQTSIQANAWVVLSTEAVMGFKSGVFSNTSSLPNRFAPHWHSSRTGNALSRKQNSVPALPMPQG